MRPLIACFCILFALAIPASGCGDDGVDPDPDEEISILFIGNSLT
jgi:hypothetical protein